ncbi:MAG TPA: dolichyl-phosphate beta-glucosyltransferase [Phycisphaerae bacterium]|nr:dolichyl-phosphate beta-glucosyltransferase [Phycisphaerae bacterium]
MTGTEQDNSPRQEHSGPSSGEPLSPELSIIVPAYNEARCIATTLVRIRAYAVDRERRCEVIVVDDGSADGTSDIVRRFAAEPLDLRLLVNPTNCGKGYAVREGMLAATGGLALMCDADLSTPIEELEKLLSCLERGYDVVIGSRDMPESVLDPPQPLLRRWLAWRFRAIRRRLLLRELRDTQCGFKLFRRDAARKIFSRQTITGWLFDCEVLGIAERLGYRIKEVGVVWGNNPDSRVRTWREAFTALPRLLSIRRRLAKVSKA